LFSLKNLFATVTSEKEGSIVERQNSITRLGITNFLECGALLRRNGLWILIEGPFKETASINNTGISVFCPDFYNVEEASYLEGNSVYALTTEAFVQACNEYLQTQEEPKKPLQKALWHEPDKRDFALALQQIHERIEKREIHKAVPVVFAHTQQSVSAVDRAQLLLQLIGAPASLHVYGFWQGKEGVLGATPEVLFEFHDDVLRTMALAGTCPKSEGAERLSLLEDEKEMFEHQLVLEDITSVLSAWGSLQTQGPTILELPTLYHLKTEIRVSNVQQPDFKRLTEALHPTPALGVAPRSVGYHWMAKLPGQLQRGRFGAPFAFLSAQEAVCLVGIRNLQWNSQLAMIGSGCGIVAGSELEREWREVYEKRRSVKKILGLEL
jgi:menaquinone-specific isochorismate synthase